MKLVSSSAQKVFRIYEDDLTVLNELPPSVYIVRFSPMQGFFLEKYNGMEVAEEKIYGVHLKKIDKVLNTFNNFERNLGIILSGDKGIGKSLFARVLCQTAIKSGFPVVVIDSYVPGISSFIEEIEQQVVLMFDEFDKTFSDRDDGNGKNHQSPQASMLSLLDGVSSGKKMFVVTCNRFTSLDEYLINRPGRFHYHFRFKYPTSNEIREYLQDKVDPKYHGEIHKVVSFGSKVNLNYDCLRAIAYELQSGESFESAISDLNILKLNEDRYNLVLHFSDGSSTGINNHNIDMFNP